MQARQVESALGLWRQMAALGTPPSVDNCNALLNACVDCDQGERALDIYRSMKGLGAPSYFHPYRSRCALEKSMENRRMRVDCLPTGASEYQKPCYLLV